MRILFISDIHGIKTNLPKIKERFDSLKCDKLVVLGDIYHLYSSYNQLEDYDVDYVKEFLESFKPKLICIKGNCDSEIDKMGSAFSVGDELAMIPTINEDLYLTHGHIYNVSNWYKTNTTLIFGHLHIPFIKERETNTYICVGSISIPRSNFGATYLFYNEEEFIIYDINDHVVARKRL